MSVERREREKKIHTELAADAHSFNFALSIYLAAQGQVFALCGWCVCERAVLGSEDTSARLQFCAASHCASLTG